MDLDLENESLSTSFFYIALKYKQVIFFWNRDRHSPFTNKQKFFSSRQIYNCSWRWQREELAKYYFPKFEDRKKLSDTEELLIFPADQFG